MESHMGSETAPPRTDDEFGTIDREIYVDAAPDVVFQVISTPEHVRQWWPDEADFDATPGGGGEIVFGSRDAGDAKVAQFSVVEAEPPRRFSFRWTHPEGQAPTPTNSLLVTFELVPSGAGTLVRLSETGFREQGWEIAVLEECYRDHSNGWDHFVPQLGTYVERLVSAP
jgi:uncharacterized protein YndB with AHSA1/START domain